MSTNHCRVCFEFDDSVSKLITPCQCKGTSLYIHQHCLLSWQDMLLSTQLSMNNSSNSNTRNPFMCPVCRSHFTYPSKIAMVYRRISHWLFYYMNITYALIILLWQNFVIVPLKILLHSILIVVTLPFGQLSLGNVALAWIGCEFPPQLALIHQHDLSGGSIDHLAPHSLEKGVLLVASKTITSSSIFHKSVILLLEHSNHTNGSRGVIINWETNFKNYFNNNHNNLLEEELSFGIGGPMETDDFTVIHNYHNCKKFSKTIIGCNESSHHFNHNQNNGNHGDQMINNNIKNDLSLYIAEYDGSFRTLRMISSLANKRAKGSNDNGDQNNNFNNLENENISSRVLILRGNCSWLPHQLEGEIKAGEWHVMPLKYDYIFPNRHVIARKSIPPSVELNQQNNITQDRINNNNNNRTSNFFRRSSSFSINLFRRNNDNNRRFNQSQSISRQNNSLDNDHMWKSLMAKIG
eukprot:gene7413-10104_t